jgi:hypothetical protein
MTAPSRVALGAAMLARGWLLDIDTAYPGTASWAPVSGVSGFIPTNDDTLKDVTTNDDGGNNASQKTAQQWSLEFNVKRAPQASALTAYDVGAEKLRALSLLLGASNLAHVRWYESNGTGYPVTEAWEGVGAVTWNEGNSATDDPRMVKVKITGFGARTVVSPNPASA